MDHVSTSFAGRTHWGYSRYMSDSQDKAPAWLEILKGKFIVFDGPDGSGKSTQFRLLGELVHEAGFDVCEVREPGGTPVGERIREVLLDPSLDEMAVRCELLLYMASRAQLASQTLKPAKESGAIILADRFISSTLAYQGSAGGLAVDDIMHIGQFAVEECWPDLVIIFDVEPEIASQRLNPELDRMELKGDDYHKKVRGGYLDQAKENPSGYLLIDAGGSIADTFKKVLEGLKAKFG